MIKKSLIKVVDTLKQHKIVFNLLLIYVITLPLSKRPANLPLLLQKLQLSEIVFLFLFFFWIKGLIKDKKLPQDTGLNRPFLIFMVFCLFSFFHSTNLLISTVELAALIYLFIMFVLAVDIVDSKRRLDIIVKAWIGVLAVVLAFGLIGLCISIITGRNNPFCWVYHGNFPYTNKAIYRVTSIFRYPQGLAGYLIASLSFVVSDLLLTENRRYKVFLKVILSFTCLMVFATISREILSFILSSFLIYNYFRKVKNLRFRIIRFLSIFLIVSMFLFVAIFCSSFYIRSYKIENFFKDTHREFVINIDYAHDTRLALKVAALEMVKRHPFLGVGLRMSPLYIEKLNDENYFKNFIPIYFLPSYKGNQYLNFLFPTVVHNEILQYFAETGLFGGGAFVILIATFLYLVFTNLRKRQDNRYFKVRLFCFTASFIGILVDSIDTGGLKTQHCWFLMALALALIMMHKKEKIA